MIVHGAHETLRRRAKEGRPVSREGERRAFGRRPRQVPKRRGDVEIGGRAEDEPARQHDLVDPATPDRTGEQADRPLPIRTIGPFLDRLERAGRGPAAVAGATRGRRVVGLALGRLGDRLPGSLYLTRIGIV